MGRSINERPSLLEGEFFHRLSNRHYTVSGGVMKRHQVDPATGRPINEIERSVTLAIGSGNHAVTYAHRTAQGRLFELPLSWYSKDRAYSMSPGYDRADHFDFRREISESCLFCHSNSRTPEPIGCERCHASSAAHRAKPGRGNILKTGSLDVCLQCHLETSSSRFLDSLRLPGREVFSYRPGEPLGDYKVHFAPPAGSDDRFEINSAGYRLLQSRCYRESKSAMTCVTCHDPHSARVKSVTCRQCHVKPHTEADCIGCHMPQRIAADAIHVSMTDHRIERKPSFVNPVREDHTLYTGPLASFFTHAAPLALERANTLDPTVDALRRFLAASPNDASLRVALGRALIRAGRADEAVAALEKASDSAGRTYLAVAYAVQGETGRALAILKEVVAENPDHALAWINLGITHEALGNKADAIVAYERAILIQPDASEARRRLQALRQVR